MNIEVYNDSEHFRETQSENEIEQSIHYLISHYYLILNRPVKAYNEVIINAISPQQMLCSVYRICRGEGEIGS